MSFFSSKAKKNHCDKLIISEWRHSIVEVFGKHEKCLGINYLNQFDREILKFN